MTIQRALRLAAGFLAAIQLFALPVQAADLDGALARAGENRSELEAAIAGVPEGEEREAMAWLIEHMPEGDLTTLSAEYLVTSHRLAFEAWRSAPWRDSVDTSQFLDAVLPYASVNERRDAWRADLRERCLPLVAEAKTPSEAAALLNNKIWSEFGVKYSTKRAKPDQSPFETMESGLASCTGLSVLLIDSCRAVGVPARFVGTPRWSDDSGNHSWVEIWDDGWHYTGAAEPTGNELDQGWFGGRAAGAKRDEPKYAIYATTWRDTPTSFPLVWRPGDESVNAVNVTDRYTSAAPEVEEGKFRVRFRTLDPRTGERVSAHITVEKVQVDILTPSEQVFSGDTKDEGFDSNDHVMAPLEEGVLYRAHAVSELGRFSSSLFTAEDGMLLSLGLEGPDPWSLLPLTREEADRLQARKWSHYLESKSWDFSGSDSGVLMQGEFKLPFWYKVYGDEPANGRSLYISMHGGGGAPKRTNDQQWENQKRLYTPDEGVYLAPRAATDTWNLWHQAHIDGFFDRLIKYMIVAEGVDPDRVYLLGYSAGGDGVYQLAPRMADRFAAVAMMAGHPNETQPDGLRNLPFTLHMGGEDSAYDRNKIGREWKTKLADLAAADPGGYPHLVEIHEGKGHWMDREDAAALPWMAKHTRNLRPERIVWLQDDVTHERFYWLRNPAPKARERIVVERKAQVITIVEAPPGTELQIRLDDSMCDLDSEVIVRAGEVELFRGIIPRTAATITSTLSERGDPRGVFTAKITVTTPN